MYVVIWLMADRPLVVHDGADKRKAEAEKILSKYPDRIPVRMTRARLPLRAPGSSPLAVILTAMPLLSACVARCRLTGDLREGRPE